MKKRKSKKWLIVMVVIIILLAISAGAFYYFKNRKQKEVAVYSVKDVGMENYWENSSTSNGSIKEDKMQSVYLSTTQQVDKVLVKEGQNVKEGDVLLTYNTTLSNLELERKQLDIKKLQLDLTNAQKELAQIRTYQPDVPIYGSLPVEPPVIPETTPTVPDKLPDLTPPTPAITPESETNPAPLTGDGTPQTPYLFIWEENKEYEKSFIQSLFARTGNDKTEVIAIFMNRENNSMVGNLKTASKIKFTQKEKDYNFGILEIYSSENDPLYPNQPIEEVPIVPEEPALPEVGPIYTATELQRMIMEKEKEISEISLNIKVAQSEHKKLQAEMKNTKVYSKLNGVVKTVLDVEDETIGNKPIIVVSGGGGYYVQGRIGELDLNSIKVGQKVNVRSYESGMASEGVVEKISEYPLNGSYYNGNGNSNVSYYPYTVRVEESANFKDGEWVGLELIADEEQTKSFFISAAFVLSENGKNHVFVADENKQLQKREISIGKNMYNMLEVRGGISLQDRVAFPYGKEVKEGAPTRESSVEELYARNVERR